MFEKNNNNKTNFALLSTTGKTPMKPLFALPVHTAFAFPTKPSLT